MHIFQLLCIHTNPFQGFDSFKNSVFCFRQLQQAHTAPTNGNNLIKINIFFDSLNKHGIEDKIDYAFDVWSLFNALSGCLSLARHLLLQHIQDS